MNPLRLTPEECCTVYYGRCYDILRRASAPERDRSAFIDHFKERESMEWRFQGVLGFGGKFYRNDERVYVGCYREDETPAICARIVEINKLLDRLGPPPSPAVQGEIADVDERLEAAANAGVVRGIVLALAGLPPPEDRAGIRYVLKSAGLTRKSMEEAGCPDGDIDWLVNILEKKESDR